MRNKPRKEKKKKQNDQVILSGISPVEQCLLANSRPVFKLVIKEGRASPRIKKIEDLAAQRKLPIERTDAGKLANLSGSARHQGVVLVCGELRTQELSDFFESISEHNTHLIIALDQIEDPQNFGAIIRSASYLGASGCVTLKRHSAPLSSAASKASAGALESFPIIQVTNLSETLVLLRNEGYLIIGADSSAEAADFQSIPKSDRLVLVFGNEGQGLRQLTRKRCEALVNISGSGMMESLNVSAAAAILIHHYLN